MSTELRAEIEQWASDWTDGNVFAPGMEGLGELHAILDHAALTAAAPAIQAAAWDAVIARIDLGTPYMVDEKYVAGANWVRNQIEDVLKPTIERHEGHHTFHRPATEPAEVTS